MSGIYFEDIEVGQEVPQLVKEPTNLQLFMFSAVTWNLHRIHYDADFARDRDKLPNVVTHRGLLGNFLAQMLADWMKENGALKKIEWSVRGSAMPGDKLTCRGKITKKYKDGNDNVVACEIWIENQKGDTIVPGSAELVIISKN